MLRRNQRQNHSRRLNLLRHSNNHRETGDIGETPGVEAEPAPEPQSVSEPSAPQQQSPETGDIGETPGVEAEPADQDYVDVNHPGADVHLEEMASYREPPPEFSRQRKGQRKLFGTLAIIFILGFFLWLGYVLFAGFVEEFLFNDVQDDGRVTSLDPSAGQSANSDYITILEPGDPSALVTAGRGTAEIINERNADMLRIISVRESGNRKVAANPDTVEDQARCT